MSSKDITFFTVIFLCIFLIGGFLSFNLFSNESLPSVVVSNIRSSQSTSSKPTQTVTCSNKPRLPLDSITAPELIKLRTYQNICESFLTDTLMYFTLIPTEQTVDDLLKKDMQALLQFKQAGVKPNIIWEPYGDEIILKWTDIYQGKYDAPIQKYLKEIQKFGITSEDIALFTPLPEANVPSWGLENNNPRNYALAFTHLVGQFRQVFAQVESSILLNSQSYEPTDINWENGEYTDFSAYTNDIPRGVVDQFGVQGFPWASAANRRKIEIFDPKEFLSPELSVTALKNLKIKKIWFNTGTFGSKYNSDPEKKITVLPPVRKRILSDIASVANNLADKGYEVKINVFAENKSNTQEGTDWSYNSGSEKVIVRDFARTLDQKGIGFMLSDK